MRKHTVSILLCIFIAFCWIVDTWAGEFYATVTKISDGDTIWVRTDSGKKLKIRLIGIDTPEKYSGRKLERDASHCGVKAGRIKNLGQLATHHMKTLLHKGDRVKIVPRGRGYYKRLLAYVILPDGSNLNYRMVADGYACVYTWHGKRPEGVGVLEFVKLKAFLLQAKKEERGLWRVDFELMNCLCR